MTNKHIEGMKTSYDLNIILYNILKHSPDLPCVYHTTRPAEDHSACILVNTIAVSQEFYPQQGTGNVNIYIPDKKVMVATGESYVPDLGRLEEVSRVVLGLLRGARVEGLSLRVESQSIIREPQVNQHLCNIRIGWVIH